jgi:hypothetical protein
MCFNFELYGYGGYIVMDIWKSQKLGSREEVVAKQLLMVNPSYLIMVG